jgi:hypothetical protein
MRMRFDPMLGGGAGDKTAPVILGNMGTGWLGVNRRKAGKFSVVMHLARSAFLFYHAKPQRHEEGEKVFRLSAFSLRLSVFA